LVDDLTLVMNKLRQDSITNELLDLVGGMIALEG
jgi:F0F1-type ATP synthase gamma subunit